MRTTPATHTLLLKWLLLISVIGVALGLVWDRGLLHLLFASDQSHISLAIVAIFAIASAHAAWRVWILSREIDQTRRIADRLERAPGARFHLTATGRVTLDGTELGEHLITRHTGNLLRRFAGIAPPVDPGAEQTLLLNALDRRVRGAHDVGWFIADLMLKLGLLGTVIGFVIMLGSITDIDDLDIAAMQTMLQQMSGGMRVALFTTLSGLLAGILLGMQYQLVDRGADELIGRITETTEIYVIPRLAARPTHAAR